MIQNYEYFLTLAETQNISRAAERLYVSHQCLSRYLKTLEEECGLTLFERKPSLSLTYAGQVLLEGLREIQRVEQSTKLELTDLKNGSTGVVRLGITEGRLRIVLPDLLKRYQSAFSGVTLKASSAPTSEMLEQLLENKLDLVLGGTTDRTAPNLTYDTILEEDLYLVVSDNLLRKYFHGDFPACKQELSEGADLSRFREMPFCATARGYNSRAIVDDFMQKNDMALNIIYEANQPDLLHMMTAQDYAASFCLSMYLPNIRTLNRTAPADNQLNVFPIRGLTVRNPIFLISQRGRYFPRYTKELIQMIRRQCRDYCAAGPESVSAAVP